MPSTEYFKTIDPDLYNLNLYYDAQYYQKFSNYYKVLVYGIDTLANFIEYNKSKVIDDPIDARVSLYKTLDSKGMDTYKQLQYKIFWYEKFFNDIEIIKQQFREAVPKPVYFKEISDSIGLLRNFYTVPDDATLLIKDNDFTVQKAENIALPIGVGASVYTKLRPNTIYLTTQMGFLNTVLFRHNVSNVQGNFAYPNQAHGENLVTDFYHINKMNNMAKEVLEKSLRTFYGKLYDLILFYENYNPQDYTENNFARMPKGAIEVNIGDTIKKIDYLQQQVVLYVNTVNLYKTLGANPVA